MRGLINDVARKVTDKVVDVEQAAVKAIKPDDLQRTNNLTPNEVNTISTQLAPEQLAKEALDNTQLGRVVDPARHEYRNFSLESIEGPEDIKAILDNPTFFDGEIGALAKDPNKHQSWEETVDKAFENSKTVNEFLKKGKVPRTADELVRGKQLLYMGAQELKEAAKELKLSQGDVQKEYRFRAMVAKQAALYQAFTGSVNETGRALNALKITIGNDDRMMEQMNERLGIMGGSKTTQKMADVIMSLGDDAGKITDFAVENKHKRYTQAMNEWISASHLWQPTTHFANVVGNTGAVLTGVGERYLASGIGKARKFLGVGSEVDRVKVEEANAMIHGMVEGLMTAPRIFAKAWRDHEKEPDFLMSKGAVKVDGYFKPSISSENLLGKNMNSPLGKMIDALAPHMVRMPFRLLGASDEVFKTMSYNMQSYAHARRSLAQEGISTSSKEYKERMQKILSGEDEVYSGVVNDAAIDYAEYSTFTNSLTDSLSQNAQQMANSSPLIKMFLPYVRTPTNVVKFATERTALAPVLGQWRDQFAKGGAERDIAISKVMLGSTVQAGALMAMLNTEVKEVEGKEVEIPRPLITGNYPKSRKLGQVWKENGIQPWSVYIDGEYHAYNRLDPFGMQIGMMAQGVVAAKGFEDPSQREEAWLAMSVGLGEYFSEKAYFQSLGDLFGMFNGQSPVQNIKRTVGNKVASTIVPSHLNWLAKSTDNGFVATTTSKSGNKTEHKFGDEDELNIFMEKNPEAEVTSHPMSRETRSTTVTGNILNQIKNRLPWERKDLKPRVDMFGNDVIMDDLTWSSYNMSAARYSEVEHNDVVANELFEQGFGYMKPNSKMKVNVRALDEKADVDLVAADPTGELFYQWQKMVGKERYQLLKRTISSSTYIAAKENDDTKGIGRRYFLEKAARKGRENAKSKFLKRYGSQLEKYALELRKQGAGQQSRPYKGSDAAAKLERNPFK